MEATGSVSQVEDGLELLLSSSSNNVEPQFPQFSSLPSELREQIWLETLAPRLIYIHPHRRLSPPRYNPDLEVVLDGPRTIVSLFCKYAVHDASTIPVKAFQDYAEFAFPPQWSLEQWRTVSPITPLQHAKRMATHAYKYKSADPPAALYVCSESRAAAIRRGYVLAFKGVHKSLDSEDQEFWEKNHLGEKGIWVDFEQDMIMMDTAWKPASNSECALDEPLRLLAMFMSEDVKSIKRIALGGAVVDTIMKALRGQRKQVKIPDRRTTDFEWVSGMGYVNLKEIWVDDSFSSRLAGEGHIVSQTGHDTYDQIVAGLQRGKSMFLDWPSELPLVKIVRGVAWHDYF